MFAYHFDANGNRDTITDNDGEHAYARVETGRRLFRSVAVAADQCFVHVADTGTGAWWRFHNCGKLE